MIPEREPTLAERARDPLRDPLDPRLDNGIPGWRACLVCGAVGLAIGIGGSAWWPWGPWGFAKEPPAEAPAWQPKMGEVLTAGPDAALVRDVAPAEHGDRIASVLWLRGSRSGVQTVRVTGCSRTDGHVITPRELREWRSVGGSIFDLIGKAACAADLHPAPDGASPRSTT